VQQQLKEKVMVRMIGWLAVAGSLLMSLPCGAQSDPNATRENAQLRQRVDALEKLVQELQGKAPVPPAAPAPETTKKPFWSTLDIQFYGYIKLDAAWDSAQVYPGDYVLFAEEDGEGDDEFNLTAKQTRLGLKITGPDVGTMKTSGLVEADFYGSAGAENKPNLLVRHAYMLLDWPDDQFSLLAGQASDVISPLFPNTLNYTVLWDGGNIGYRHPQIRATKGFALQDDVKLELTGAVSRTIADFEDTTKAGADAGFPTVQGRAGLTFPCFGDKPTTAGLSGHWGQEEYGDNDVDSWSLNLDVLQPVNEWLSFKGEAFVGENLDDYFGGIGQGVRNPTTTADRAIRDRGGWVQATMTPYKQWSFNVGVGIDDVDNSDVNTGGRTLNRSIYGNAIYAINTHADVGVELSQWRTDYKNGDDTDDVRIQTSLIYKF
jgi:hypothetical protein